MKFKDTEYGDLTGQHYDGSIKVGDIGLTSLEGAPETVGGDFLCDRNELTSLEGSPKTVGGDFDCDQNNLTSLEGAPEKVGGGFKCFKNNLTSLNGAPETVGGNFLCFSNPNPHLETEWEVRKENPDLTEEEIAEIMYKETEDERYVPEEIQNVFLF